MATDLIHDRGRGSELVGTRITVYNLLPYFLDAESTEDDICRSYGLTPEQVAAARAYVLTHPDTVLAQHLEIEAAIARGNPPEVVEQAKRTHEIFARFRAWLAEQEAVKSHEQATLPDSPPSFREWSAQQEARPAKGR